MEGSQVRDGPHPRLEQKDKAGETALMPPFLQVGRCFDDLKPPLALP